MKSFLIFCYLQIRNGIKRIKHNGESFCHVRLFCGTYNKFMVNYMGIHVNIEREWP